jgi:hypothetical protein
MQGQIERLATLNSHCRSHSEPLAMAIMTRRGAEMPDMVSGPECRAKMLDAVSGR